MRPKLLVVSGEVRLRHLRLLYASECYFVSLMWSGRYSVSKFTSRYAANSMLHCDSNHILILFPFLLVTLQPYMGFGLHQLIPGFYFDDLSPISQFNFFKSFIVSYFHLFFGRPSFLTPIALQQVIFRNNFIPSIF